MRLKLSILVAAAALVVASGTLAVTGSVVIFDPSREVASAHIVAGLGHMQPLVNLAILQVAVPNIEGAVEVTCKSGRVVKGGYVTGGLSTWQKVVEADCRRS